MTMVGKSRIESLSEFLKIQHMVATRVQELIRNDLRLAERIYKRVQAESQTATQLTRGFEEQFESITTLTAALSSSLNEIERQNSHIAEQFRLWVETQPERDKKQYQALEELARLGWYLDSKMPWNAAELLTQQMKQTSSTPVVDEIKRYFRERLDHIEVEVSKNWPNRRHILLDAFHAHRGGKYNLSIPVFLAQADGMWFDKFETNVFRRKDREGANIHLSDVRDQLRTMMFALFGAQIPIWASKSQRENDLHRDSLNRHEVLHGETTDYGSEENSLKAISFLGWLNWVLNETGESHADSATER